MQSCFVEISCLTLSGCLSVSCVPLYPCTYLWATVSLSVSFSPCLAFYVSIWVSGRLYVCFRYLGCMWFFLSFSVFCVLLYIAVHVCKPRSVTVCQSAHVHPLVDVLPVCVLPCVSMHKSVYCTVSGCFCVFACMWLLLSFSVYLCVTVHLCTCLWATVNLSVSFSPGVSWVAL